MNNYNYKKNILKKINSKKLCISVIGLGYVGLPLSLLLSKKDRVIGIDIDKKKINYLNLNKSYIERIENKKIRNFNKKNIFSTDFSKIFESDFIIICVPTPLKKDKSPDLSFIKNAVSKIKPNLKKGQTIILESTSYPGTTREIISNNIEKMKFQVGKNFFVCFSSEREDPGNKKFSIEKITKVVSGYSNNCLILCKNLYSKITKVHSVSSLRTAETTKLFENIFRSG